MRILLSGATGQQGGATLRALAKINSSTPATPRFSILALTRSLESAKARELASYPNVKLIQGDLNEPERIFERVGGRGSVDGVFSVTASHGKNASVEKEEVQGKAFADAAFHNGVSHFVYSSVDRGPGSPPTAVPHFISKHRIEQHLQSLCQNSSPSTEKKMNWTILRPTAFMDNFSGDLFGKIMAASFKAGVGMDQPVQYVSVEDIGRFAARAFERPSEHSNLALSLAGDSLSLTEISRIYKRVTGRVFPIAYFPLGHLLLLGVSDIRKMFEFFRETGYNADIEECKRRLPNLETYEMFLKRREMLVNDSNQG